MRTNIFILLFFIATLLLSCQKEEINNQINTSSENISAQLKAVVFENEPNNSIETANSPIDSYDTFNGTVESYQSLDYVRLNHYGGPIAISLSSVNSYTSLILYNNNNNYIISIADEQTFVITNLNAGTYYIMISGYGGEYTVKVNHPFQFTNAYIRVIEASDINYSSCKKSTKYICANYNFLSGFPLENIMNFGSSNNLFLHPIDPMTSFLNGPSYNVVHVSEYLSNGYPVLMTDRIVGM